MKYLFPFASLEIPGAEAAESAVETVTETAQNLADAASETVSDAVAPAAAELGSALYWDIGTFVGFILLVLFVGIFMSRRSKSGENSESYFLAGRGLTWWLIGFSLIAANISAEQFVGMSGNAAEYVGMAIASFEWLAAVSLVIVAFFFLPQFLKTGIYTIPEFLEKRYNKVSRTLVSLMMGFVLIVVSFAAVVYAGSTVFHELFHDLNIMGFQPSYAQMIFAIGVIAMLYVAFGGLKACAWADLIQGSALIAGGAMILYFAIQALGEADPAILQSTAGITAELADKVADQSAWDRFFTLNSDKLRMNLPSNDPILPYTALLVGLWIPNLYYWGLNQYIVQRTLGSQSLSEGQKGIVFAAFMKLIMPFIIVFPGIIAFNLYSTNLKDKAAAENNNGKTYAAFVALEAKPDPSSMQLFEFDENFSKLYPEDAEKILAYNAAKLGVEQKSEDSLMDRQGVLLKKAKEENQKRSRAGWSQWFGLTSPEEGEEAEEAEVLPPYKIEKKLVGYHYDSTFAVLVTKVIPPGFRGFVLAAIFGAIISSLAAVLNAASTIVTLDLCKEYIVPSASEKTQVFLGRIFVVTFGIIGCCIGLFLNDPRFGGIFKYIQEFQGFISPGILAAFIFGFFARYAPAACGPTALISSPVLYGLLMRLTPDIPYLDRMAITFAIILAVLGCITAFFPRKEPFVAQGETTMDLRPSRSAKVCGIIVILITICLYLYFWEYNWTALGHSIMDIVVRVLP